MISRDNVSDLGLEYGGVMFNLLTLDFGMT
jgi:hypothetical protein